VKVEVGAKVSSALSCGGDGESVWCVCVCAEPQLQPTLDRWKDFSPFLRSFGLFAAAALPSLVVVFGTMVDYRL